jgi:adenosylcobinamide-GDP ribazoletransferase
MARDPLVISPAPPAPPAPAAPAAGHRVRIAGAAPAPALDLAAALAFLTRVPIPRGWLIDDRTGAATFGLAGAAVGAVAGLPLVVFGQGHPGPAAVVALAMVAILSGGLHLDGLADTADALAAPTGAADRARTDPQAGSAGVVAVLLILLLDAALLSELASAGGWFAAATMVSAAAASRAAAPVAGVLVGRARSGGRLGAWFAARLRPADALLAIGTSVTVAAIAAVATSRSIGFGLVGGGAIAVAAGAAIVRLRGRLDGDGFGALIELAFAAVLAATVAARSIVG